jgi:CMP-N,N'-diacetyllegionaminic acid synthase
MSVNGRKIFALIPARGGSKGVSGKNMRVVNGKPLIGYTIDAAQKSKYIDGIWVSSDDSKTLEYAANSGINTLKRPDKYSDDKATANQVIAHFLLDNNSIKNKDYIIYLQPTSPLRTNIDIDHAIGLIDIENCDSVISVVVMEKSPYKSFVLNDDRLYSLFDENKTNACRQDIPIAYMPNGAIYLFKASNFIANNIIPSNGSKPYFMNKYNSIDIDTEDDLILLDKLLPES